MPTACCAQAVERNFEIIGEAVRRLAQVDPASAEGIAQYPRAGAEHRANAVAGAAARCAGTAGAASVRAGPARMTKATRSPIKDKPLRLPGQSLREERTELLWDKVGFPFSMAAFFLAFRFGVDC